MNNITILLTTCDRYNTTLPLCLLSIINQTRVPNRVVIVDDSRNNIFYSHQQIKQILLLSKLKGIQIDYFYGDKKGAVPALQLGLDNIKDGWVFKIDDDTVLDPDVIEKLEYEIKDDVGGMSCLIIDKESIKRSEDTIYMSSKIEDLYIGFNVQMVGHQTIEPKYVEHLFCNYFFRRDLADDYPTELQPSALREETIFTHSIFRKGYKLLVFPNLKIYHLKGNDKSGDRQWGEKYHEHNEMFMLKKLEEWEVIPDKMVIHQNEKGIYTEKNGTKYVIYQHK